MVNPDPNCEQNEFPASDIDARKVHVTLFKNTFAKTRESQELTLPELRDRILAESGPTKAALPLLKLAIFGKKKTDKGSLRHDANVTSIEGLELDYDGEAVSFEDAIETIKRTNVRALLYTSPSHTVALPRWRVLFPLSASEPRLEMREKLVARVNGFFDGIFGPESFKLSLSYYYGRANDNPDADHRAVVIDGRFINLCDDLYRFELAGMPKGNAADAADTSSEAADNLFTRAGNRPQGDDKWRDLNTEALANLGKWVPALFPEAKKSASGYRVTSKALGRNLEEDLSITPQGIKDFGTHDIGDPREGKRTPIDVVIEWGGKDRFEAFAWLREQLGHHDPDGENDEKKRPIVSDKDHVARARKLRDIRRPNLLHYRDDFMDFDAGAYRVKEDGVIIADIWNFLDQAKASRMVGRGKNAKREIVSFQPDRNSVGETLAALKAIAHLDPGVEGPCWLDGRNDLPPDELIAFPNGLLDLRHNKLHPVDAAFFTVAALGFDYTAAAPNPRAWLKFLDEIFAGEDRDEQVSALQEVFGYLLTSDTSQEKAFLFLGPKRSFIAERCVLEADADIEKRELYEAWCDYCRENNSYPGTLEKFCEGLYAAAGGLVRSGRPWKTVTVNHECPF